MRLIRQDRTSYISLQARNTPDADTSTVIMKSSHARDTEVRALANPHVFDNGKAVIQPKPSNEHRLCNDCGEYVHSRGFATNLSRPDGLEPICKSCKAIRDKRGAFSQVLEKYGISRRYGGNK